MSRAPEEVEPTAWWRLQRAILLAALALIVLVVAVAQSANVARSYRTAESAALTNQVETAAALARATRLFVERYVVIARTAAQAISDGAVPAGARRAFLAYLRRQYPEIAVIALVDATGRTIDGDPPVAVGTDVSDRGYYREIAGGADVAVSDLVVGKLSRDPEVPVAAAIRAADGRLAGLVVLSLPTSSLGQELSLTLSGGAYAVVVDRTGRVVVHGELPDLPWERRDFSGLPIVTEALRGRTGVSREFAGAARRQARLGAMVPVHGLGWAAGVFQPRETALAPAHRELRFALVTTAVVLGLGGLAAAWLSLALARPLMTLAAGVSALARGELSHRVALRARGELRRLLERFNAMAAHLESASRTQHELTAELLVTNEELQANTMQLEESVAELEATNQTLDEATQRAELAHRRLVTTLDALPDGVLICDADGVVVLANEGTRRLLGPQYVAGSALPPPEPEGPIARARSGEVLRVDDLLLRHALLGDRLLDVRLVVVHEGSRRILSAAAVPVMDDRGQLSGAVALFRDVTTEQRVEEAKRHLVMRASHELRTPLSAINGAIVLLRRALAGRTRENPETLLVMAERNVQHMVRLIDDLLHTAAGLDARVTLRIEHLDLAVVLGDVLDQLMPVGRDREIALSLAVDAGLTVEADRLRLEQIVVDLVGNALEFSPAGTTVAVEAHAQGEAVETQVRDEGIGPSDEHLDRVFEPFFQVRPSLGASQVRGTGLGLTVAQIFAELHGGSIRAVSGGPGRGSTFVVTLLRRQAREQAA